MTTAFPLSWPDGFPRTIRRETGQFKTTLAGALENVETSLTAFGKSSGKPVANIILSSNVSLGREKPDDPGVAVWFTWENTQICIPVDRYSTPAANLQAIHHVIEARRTELRHGTLAVVRATMKGFIALPAPGGKRPWWEVLGVERNATSNEVDGAWSAP
ncbi:MAG: J domain-containing protein [Methylocella sp.]